MLIFWLQSIAYCQIGRGIKGKFFMPTTTNFLNQVQYSSESITEYDFLSVATDGAEINNGGVRYVNSEHGPAFEISARSNLRNSYRIVAPEKLTRNFTLIATIKTNKPEGYIFSIGEKFKNIWKLSA